MVARGIGGPQSEGSKMVWRVTTIRDGTARHDPVAYITKDDALKVIKSSLDKGVIDSAYIVDPYSNTEDWAAVKKALGLS
jgi:hypothetical protein